MRDRGLHAHADETLRVIQDLELVSRDRRGCVAGIPAAFVAGIDLRATNLFDEFYLQSVSGAPIPLRGRYGAPRIVELTFNSRF